MIRKWLAIGIILLFIGTSIIPVTANQQQNTNENIHPHMTVSIKG